MKYVDGSDDHMMHEDIGRASNKYIDSTNSDNRFN